MTILGNEAQDEKIALLEKLVAKLEAIIDKSKKEKPDDSLSGRVDKLYSWIENGQRF